MPQPTVSDLHVNVPLTNISIAWMQKAEHFVAGRVFPNVPVQKQSDRYYQYDRAYWFSDEMKLRAPATESAGSGWKVDATPTYYCPVWALHKDISDQERANADPQVNPDMVATQWLSLKALIKKDLIWATNYFVTGVWTFERTGIDGSATIGTGKTGTQFNRWDRSDSTPIEDVRNAKIEMLELTGLEPNKLTLSPWAFEALLQHGDILDRVKYTQRGIISAEILAAVFDVEQVLIAKGVRNAAAEGLAESNAFIMGKHALLSYSPPTPALQTPSAGYTFSWQGMFGAGAFGSRISSFRQDNLKADRTEIEMAFDLKLVSADLGYFFRDVVN